MKYLDLKTVNSLYGDDIREALCRVADSGWYLRGHETARFEEEYARYIGTSHCVGCANGLDALTLIIRAYKELGRLSEGDEVIVPANTYIASILSVTENRLVPVLVEPSIDTLQIDDTLIEQVITSKTRAIMIVHLYGRCAYTARIGDICQRHGLLLIEDNAQAHGCAFGERLTGSLGNAAGHSFYPTKNLGAIGDAGAVTTDDAELAAMVRELGNYGSSRHYVFDHIGRNSRLDELQAAVLSAKLKHLDNMNARRREIADIYINNVCHQEIVVPNSHGTYGTYGTSKTYGTYGTYGTNGTSKTYGTSETYGTNGTSETYDNVYHIFPILSPRRDELKQYLAERGVQTEIHYPIPPHRQRCYPEWNSLSLPVTERIHREELSLPCNPAMTDEEAMHVVALLNSFA